MTARQFLDLAATVALAAVAAAALLVLGPGPLTLLLALPLLLLLPGYAIVSALYPVRGPDSIGPVARFALAIALSVAVTPALAFAANYTVGVYPRPVVVGAAAVTASMAVVAVGRRAAVPASDRAGAQPFVRAATIVERYLRGTRSLRSTAPLEATSGADVFVNLLVVAAVLVFAASVGFAAIVPQNTGVTETYLATTSGDDHTIVQDPGDLTSAQRDALVAVVENQEGREQQYTAVVVGQDVTRRDGDVTVTDERIVAKRSTTLAAGETWQVPVPSTDGDRTAVLVYHGQASGDPDYRLTLSEP